MELDAHADLGLRQTLLDQRREANAKFAKYVESSYRKWIEQPNREIALSPDVAGRYVFPEINASTSLFFIVVDCLPVRPVAGDGANALRIFYIREKFLFQHPSDSNAVFAKCYFQRIVPFGTSKTIPEIWQDGEDDESSRNRNEHELLNRLLERKYTKSKVEARYVKILDAEFGKQIEANILSYLPTG